MSIHYGVLGKEKTDLSDIEKRLKDLETLSAANKKGVAANLASIGTHSTEIAGNKTKISANNSSISTNTGNISTNTTKSTAAYNKAVANGDKLLRKLRYSENFFFKYVNPSVGNWSVPADIPAGYPNKHCPLLGIDSETYIHIQYQKFDTDTTMDGTEKAEYKISFVDTSGNVTSWTSPTQTISASGRKLHDTMYVIDVLCQISVARPADWQNLRAFSVAYKPVAPSKVGGNESVLFVHVYSKG